MPDAGLADGSVLTSANYDTYLRQQVVAQVTSATRPTGVEGRLITETDSNLMMAYSGTGWSSVGPLWGVGGSWTPAVSQSTTPTLTVTRAAVHRMGRRVWGDCVVSITSTATAANAITVSLPYAHTNTSGSTIIGQAQVYDSSAGFWYYANLVVGPSSTSCYLQIQTNGAAATYLGSTSFTAALASGDIVSYTFNYESGSDA